MQQLPDGSRAARFDTELAFAKVLGIFSSVDTNRNDGESGWMPTSSSPRTAR
jgi:xylose isomerase